VVTDHPCRADAAAIERKERTMEATTNNTGRELAHRSSCGIDVTLLWDDETDELVVTAFDSTSGELLELPAAREHALDVFHHPYAYAARAA
jgi:hypothetical protein